MIFSELTEDHWLSATLFCTVFLKEERGKLLPMDGRANLNWKGALNSSYILFCFASQQSSTVFPPLIPLNSAIICQPIACRLEGGRKLSLCSLQAHGCRRTRLPLGNLCNHQCKGTKNKHGVWSPWSNLDLFGLFIIRNRTASMPGQTASLVEWPSDCRLTQNSPTTCRFAGSCICSQAASGRAAVLVNM